MVTQGEQVVAMAEVDMPAEEEEAGKEVDTVPVDTEHKAATVGTDMDLPELQEVCQRDQPVDRDMAAPMTTAPEQQPV